MLMEPMRHKNVRGYNGVIFRTQFTDIIKPGGLWEESEKMYTQVSGSRQRFIDKQWLFCDKKGNVSSKLTFAYLNDQNLLTWKGSQICFIGFDEVTDFSEKQFFFMFSRNRSTCGVAPYIRATCNPDPDSWVKKFIDWWIDPQTGYAIQERSGVIRWMIRRNAKIYWADTKEELWERFNLVTPEDKAEPRSVTFIASSIYDNKELLKVNPQYLSNLKAMGEVDRERFLKGNWKIKPAAGLFFQRYQIKMIDAEPNDLQIVCRAWDIAATEKKEDNDPDFTAGVLMGRRKNGTPVVLNVINVQVAAGNVEKLIYNTAVMDKKKYGTKYRIHIPQDPGGAGKIVAVNYVKMLAGFAVQAEAVSGSKENRARPLAAQWQLGNIEVLAAEWNEEYFLQLESFPEGSHDDMVDASSDSFIEVTKPQFDPRNLT